MVNHHPIIENFTFSEEPTDSDTIYNGLGGRESVAFTRGAPTGLAHKKTRVTTPPFDEEYFEWIDLLSAIEESDGVFTIAEFGAGFGRWLINGVSALRQRQPDLHFKLIGIEAEPTHFDWMKANLLDNGVKLDNCKLIQAAITNHNGKVQFLEQDPAVNWGQYIVDYREKLNWKGKLGRLIGLKQAKPSNLEPSFSVPAIRLCEALKGIDFIDIVDMDIQGSEGDVVEDGIDLMTQRVKRLHVGTHNHDVESRIRVAMNNAGWTNVWDFPCRSVVDTPYGEIEFQDGVSSWLNPHFK